MKKWILILTIISFVFLTGGSIPEKPDVVIIYTSNTNGLILPCNCPDKKIGGIFRRKAKIDYYKKAYPDSLVIDSGDFMPLRSDKEYNEFILKVMSKMGYDAVMLGDNEFDMGIEFIVQGIKKNNMKVVSTNLMWCDEEKACYYFGDLYYKKQMGRYKIGVIGIINENAVKYSKKDIKEKLIISEPIEEIKTWVEILKKHKKLDVIVLISHCGYEFDQQIAEKVKGIDVILGGHNQVLLEKGEKIKDTILIQMGYNGDYLGKLNIYLDKQSKKIIKYENTAYLMDEKVKDNEEMKKLYNDYKLQ